METSSRQYVAAAVETVKLADLASGVAKNLFTQLPNGTIPLSLAVIIVTPFNAGTADVLDIGISGGAANAYADDIDLKAVAGSRAAATSLPGMINTTAGGSQLQVTRTATGTAATAGEARIVLTYVREGVENFSEG